MGGSLLEYRKIIKFGGTSHVISLPNKWIKQNNLSKGDVIYFEQNGDNEITLHPKEKIKKKELKEINIDANNKSIDRIRREISAAYINNYNVINILDNNLESRSKEIRNLIHGLVALEVMGQTKNSIVARDFLNVKNISIKNLIKRTDIILRNMVSDTILCMKEDHCDGVNERDYDVNRLFLLTSRVIRKSFEDHETANALNISPEFAMSLHWLFINFESIGDECKRLCRILRNIKLTKKEKETLVLILKDIEEHYTQMMNAYYNCDEEAAHAIMDKKMDIIVRADKFFSENPSVVKGIIAEKLKGLESYTKNIGRIVVKKY